MLTINKDMTHSLSPPETFSDATLFVQSMDNDRVLPLLAAHFSKSEIDSAHDNALAWQKFALARALPSASYPDMSFYAESRAIPTDCLDLEATIPPSLSMALEEPDLTYAAPHAFEGRQSDIAIAAMRRVARYPGFRRSVNELLSRIAPSVTERLARRVVFEALMTVASFKKHN
ncbi:MAG: hypothetical protein ABI220_01040 [Candidatus Saccharimonadales bacterium]